MIWSKGMGEDSASIFASMSEALPVCDWEDG